jgi:hypothetical protein
MARGDIGKVETFQSPSEKALSHLEHRVVLRQARLSKTFLTLNESCYGIFFLFPRGLEFELRVQQKKLPKEEYGSNIRSHTELAFPVEYRVKNTTTQRGENRRPSSRECSGTFKGSADQTCIKGFAQYRQGYLDEARAFGECPLRHETKVIFCERYFV